MREIVRAALIAAGFELLATPPLYGSTGFAFLTATIQLAAVVAILTITWERLDASVDWIARVNPRLASTLTALLGGALVIIACRTWLHETLIYPLFGNRPDMLMLIQSGVRRALQGRNPYSTYFLPWKTTLSYGPGLWAPYVLPVVLRVDLRLAALVGEMFVPVVCAFGATTLALRGRLVAGAAWVAALGVIVISEDLRQFASIAHTPVYWPLLAIFAWFVARDRWPAAAATAGLLIVARTTMVSMAPVLLIAVWHRNRAHFAKSTVLMVATAILPFLPYAIWDWRALKFSLYDVYPQVMKTVVWPYGGAHNTIGVTGLLLRTGLDSYVEAVQVAVLLATYVLAWRAIRQGRRPLPWLPAALFAFSATTLWPVQYVYFDVLMLFASAALVELPALAELSATRFFGLAFAASVAVVAAVVVREVPRDPDLDVGTSTARPYLYAGFADDERSGRSFAWVDGTTAEVLVPRRSRADADVTIECEPNLPSRSSVQAMSVTLNGVVLGIVDLREGWQTVRLAAPSRAWIVGVNELTLSFSSAVSPLSLGLSADPRRLSVAFDRIAVRTK